jgi:flagellar hook assembly protein FlgD
VPHTYALQQNYPNPFNPTTQIEYQLPVAGSVKLTIYNTRGQEVRALVNDNQSAGYYNVTWDSKNNNGETVASGVYYYRIEAVGAQHQLFTLVKKMLLLK